MRHFCKLKSLIGFSRGVYTLQCQRRDQRTVSSKSTHVCHVYYLSQANIGTVGLSTHDLSDHYSNVAVESRSRLKLHRVGDSVDDGTPKPVALVMAFAVLLARPWTPILTRRGSVLRSAFRPCLRVSYIKPGAPLVTRCDLSTASAPSPPIPPENIGKEPAEKVPSTSKSAMFAPNMSFKDLGVSAPIAERLSKAGIETPTNAQASVMPLLLEGISMQLDYATKVREFHVAEFEAVGREDMNATEDNERNPDAVNSDEPPRRLKEDVNDVLMFGAETGCGKTLAYLLPYIQAVSDQSLTVKLKAIILVPSRELCNQIVNFLHLYFDHPPPHIVLAGGNPPDVSDTKDMRVVIATPAALLNHLRFSQKADVSDKVIVIDEADMLLSGSFLRDVEVVLDQPGMKPFATRRNDAVRAANANRLVFVGATYPHWTGEKVRSIITWMRRRYPDMRSVQTGDIHKRNSALQSRWFHLPTELERVKELARILREDVGEREKVMVFCNKAETAPRVRGDIESELGEVGIGEKFGGSIELHKHVKAAERAECLRMFRAGTARLLFCTDLASRGLDLGDVTRVIEFDFATNVVAYLHRIGRTARAGAMGVTDHFYDDVSMPLADAIRKKAETEDTVVESIFSRRRGFRRKLKKRAAEEAAVLDGADNIGSPSKSMDDVEIDEMTDEERKRWET